MNNNNHLNKRMHKGGEINALISIKPAGGGGRGRGRAWGGDLIVFVGPGVGHLTDLVLLGEGTLNLSSPDVGLIDCRLGRKRL